MKNSMLVRGLVRGLFLAVAALVLIAPAVAQQKTYTIDIPFRFLVSAHELPPGEYRVRTITSGTIQIYGVDSTAIASFTAPQLSRSLQGAAHGELVFHRYGRMYFLSQVWFGNSDAGYELNTSNTERESAKEAPLTETVLRAAK